MSADRLDYQSRDPIMRLRVIHENLVENELGGTARNLQKVIDDLVAGRNASYDSKGDATASELSSSRQRAPEAEAVEAAFNSWVVINGQRLSGTGLRTADEQDLLRRAFSAGALLSSTSDRDAVIEECAKEAESAISAGERVRDRMAPEAPIPGLEHALHSIVTTTTRGIACRIRSLKSTT